MTHAGMGNYAPKNSSNLEQTFWCLIVPRTRVKIGAFYGLLAILSPSLCPLFYIFSFFYDSEGFAEYGLQRMYVKFYVFPTFS